MNINLKQKNIKDVSIVIPTFNRAKFLDIVLPSYLNQQNVLEIIIVDDGSSDEYKTIINKYLKAFKDVKIIYKKVLKNKGQAFCRNLGIQNASGQYIMMGEDDVFLDENYVSVLRNKIQFYKNRGENIFICGNIFYQVNFTKNFQKLKDLRKEYQSYKTDVFNYRHFFGAFDQYVDEDTKVPFGHALIMVEKQAYKSKTYFEGYLANSFREESDGQIEITKLGYQGYITSETNCYHLPSCLTHNLLRFKESLKFNIKSMKSNKIFWDRHYKFLQQTYNYKYIKLFPVISYDLLMLKNMLLLILKRFYNH